MAGRVDYLDRPVSPVIPKAPRAPTIRYVDQDAPTIPLRGLDEARARAILSRVDTLMPLAAALDELDDDISRRATAKRELRVRSIGRRVVGLALVAGLALLAFSVVRARARVVAHVMGSERDSRPRETGVLVAPNEKGVVIFVDGARAGVAPEPVEVPCGVRRVRFGESGSTRTVDVPCDGRLEL